MGVMFSWMEDKAKKEAYQRWMRGYWYLQLKEMGQASLEDWLFFFCTRFNLALRMYRWKTEVIPSLLVQNKKECIYVEQIVLDHNQIPFLQISIDLPFAHFEQRAFGFFSSLRYSECQVIEVRQQLACKLRIYFEEHFDYWVKVMFELLYRQEGFFLFHQQLHQEERAIQKEVMFCSTA